MLNAGKLCKPRRLMPGLGLWLLISLGMTASVAAAADGPYYAGKTLKIVVGSSAGGGFDSISRILAKRLERHIPGGPMIVVQNMPGGSSLKAANFIYGPAPSDGTHLGVFNHSLILQTVVKKKSTHFDIEKFQWVGRMATDDLVGIMWHTAGAKTIEDAKKKEMTIGAGSASSTSSMVPRALNRLVGTKFKIVSGYPGLAERYLAMEREEISGISGASLSYLKETRPDWVAGRKFSIIHQNSVERNPEIPNVPTLAELAKSDSDRKILHLLGLTETIGKSIAFGPKVPKAAVAILRKAFDETVADPGYGKDAKDRGLIPNTMTGLKLQALFDEVSSSITPEFAKRFEQVVSK